MMQLLLKLDFAKFEFLEKKSSVLNSSYNQMSAHVDLLI